MCPLFLWKFKKNPPYSHIPTFHRMQFSTIISMIEPKTEQVTVEKLREMQLFFTMQLPKFILYNGNNRGKMQKRKWNKKKA